MWLVAKDFWGSNKHILPCGWLLNWEHLLVRAPTLQHRARIRPIRMYADRQVIIPQTWKVQPGNVTHDHTSGNCSSHYLCIDQSVFEIFVRDHNDEIMRRVAFQLDVDRPSMGAQFGQFWFNLSVSKTCPSEELCAIPVCAKLRERKLCRPRYWAFCSMRSMIV